MEDDRMYRVGGEEEDEEREGSGDNMTKELVVYSVQGEEEEVDEEDEEDDEEEEEEVRVPLRKKRKGNGNVQSLLEAVIARQQRFFSDLLESIERKEQIRERARQEREDKWRAEEREQVGVFNNALIALTRELVGEGAAGLHGMTGLLLGGDGTARPHPGHHHHHPVQAKSRFRNWKRAEVMQLIRLRGEMDSRFAMLIKRAALWDEISARLASRGIRRDGKQCREKWDKLMALYQDVAEGKRDGAETPYFAELSNILRRPGTAA